MLINSKNTHGEWFEIADEYYLSARSLEWFSGLHYPAIFAGHHALELYFKAIRVLETGQYDNNLHDLRGLYADIIALKNTYQSKEISAAVEKYWNYDQPSKYTSKESRRLPHNLSMGTENLNVLDQAVFKLRDTNIETRSGLDTIIKGETQFTKFGMRDPELALHSVILYYNNKAFRPRYPDILKEVNFQPPTLPMTPEEKQRIEDMSSLTFEELVKKYNIPFPDQKT